MTRYFFDLMHSKGMTLDETGVEFLSREEMRKAAIVALHDIARDEVGPHDHQTVAVQVRDDTSNYIFRAAVSLIAEWIPE